MALSSPRCDRQQNKANLQLLTTLAACSQAQSPRAPQTAYLCRCSLGKCQLVSAALTQGMAGGSKHCLVPSWQVRTALCLGDGGSPGQGRGQLPVRAHACAQKAS